MTSPLRLLLALLAIGSPGLAGCGSSDKDDTPKPSNNLLAERTAFLTQSTWIQTGSTSLETMNGVTRHYNLFAMAPPCLTDNTVLFQADKTYVDDEGQTRCAPADPQARATGVWELKSDGSELTVTLTGYLPVRWKIVRLTAAEYVLTRTEQIPASHISRIDTLAYHAL
jgi:hypothetical protein